MRCSEPPEGDLCEAATITSCGELLYLPDPLLYHGEEPNNCNSFSPSPGRWYKYKSTMPGTLTISKIEDFYSEVTIYDACNGNCLTSGVFPYNVENLMVETYPLQDYYILVSNLYGYPSDQPAFKVSCTEDPVFISPCEHEQNITDMLFPNEIFPNGVIQASTRIKVTNSTIGSQGNYTWQAGESVEFLPGFEVRSNAHMEVKIGPCEPEARSNN